jgi:hypothetical protein
MDDYRRHLWDALNAASRDFDQAILTLAVATLAVSVTFANDITPNPVPGSIGLLLAGWLLLLIAVGAVVTSLLTSQRVLRRMLEAIDDDASPEPARTSRTARATDALNVASGGLLVAGLTFLGIYACMNLSGGT